MSKKNLDKLFQEKFSDFGEVPDEKVWNAIEDSLSKKKKGRLIPLWWKLGGVAATLALALIVWNSFSDETDSTPTITNTDNSDIKKEGQKDSLQLPKNSKDAVVDRTVTDRVLNDNREKEVPIEKSSAVNANRKTTAIQKSIKEEAGRLREITNDAVVDGRSENSIKDASQNLEVTDKEPSLVNIDSERSDTLQIENSSTVRNDLNSTNTKIAATDQKTDSDAETNENWNIKKEGFANAQSEKKEALAKTENDVNGGSNNLTPKEQSTFGAEEKMAQNLQNNTEVDETYPKKKSILEVIDEQNEEEILAEDSNGRWSAGPSIAPVYFNALGEGSPVHSVFAQNSKSGNTNLSYGLSVAYEINKKLRVRSGILKVAYGYDTDDVAFSSSLQASASERITNIDYTSSAKNLIVKSEITSFSALGPNANDAALEVSVANSSARNGTMAQQFGYLEVPLELDYALIDRKFGVNLVGGISSLFLLDNSVTLTSGELTTEIGEANNVNTVNFSTNIGFGVNYKFTPKIQLNIEPVFKYQLNTFSEVSGDFRPFSIGVYSGLNFKF